MSNKSIKINYKQKLEDEAAQFVTQVHKLVCLEIFMITLFCFFMYGFKLAKFVSPEVIGVAVFISWILHSILIYIDIIKNVSVQNIIAIVIYILNIVLNGIYIIGILQIAAKTGLYLGNIILSAAIITMGVYLYAILYEKKNRDKPTNKKVMTMVSWGTCLAILLQLFIKDGIVMLIVDIITVILMSLSAICDVRRLGEEYKDQMRINNKTNTFILVVEQTDTIVMDLILNFVSIIKLWVDSQD